APARLAASQREEILRHAVVLGRAVDYRGLGTVEFLVHEDELAFLEVNPRIQVEHTVTEEVVGLDLVELQLRVAAGTTLNELGLAGGVGAPARTSMQLRVTADRLAADGSVVTSAGRIAGMQLPTGPGIRVDTHA